MFNARAALEEFHRILPPRTSAWLRYAQGDQRFFYPWGYAMNGQISRLEATRQILYRCGIRHIVETGTYRGTTTEWLATFKIPVTTIEIDERNYYFSRQRLKHCQNVFVERGNSVEVLTRLATQIDTSLPTFFYLDAHWHDYLPLRDEMALILSHFSAPVIMIDDFKVPGQAGYKYDDYGPGKALTAEYLEACLPPETHLFYPATPPEQETGHPRGWVVVTPDPAMEARLGTVEQLRRHSSPPSTETH